MLLGAAVIPAFADKAATTDYGYCNDDNISIGEGLAIDANANIGLAIRIPKESLTNYKGGRIIGFIFAAADGCKEHEINAFLRPGTWIEEEGTKTLKFGETVASTTDYVSFIPYAGYMGLAEEKLFDKGWTIPEKLDEDMYLGLYTYQPAQKHIIGLSTLKQTAPANSVFLADTSDLTVKEPDNWEDVNSLITVGANNPVLRAIIELPSENYSNVLQIVGAYMPNICPVGAPSNVYLYLKNDGTSEISSFEITLSLGDTSNNYPITLSGGSMPLRYESPNRNPIKIPVNVLGTGKHVLTISKVNGEENGALDKDKSYEFDIVGVPTQIAQQHIRRPLYEFFATETYYKSGIYEKDYVVPAINAFKGRITYLPHHAHDKFAQNPIDVPAYINGEPTTIELSDADRLSIKLCQNDINKEMLCANCIDRTLSMQTLEIGGGKTSMDQVLISCATDKASIEYYIPDALNIPTFASVELDNQFNAETRVATIKASGTIADLLPEGEKAKLSIFVIEETVWTNSQELPDSEDMLERFPDKNFNHSRVIRETVTDFWGDELEPGKDFVKTYTIELDNPNWNVDHMKVVAVVQRPETNDHLHLDVLNTAEEPLTETYEESGISQIEGSARFSTVIYDLQGRRLNAPVNGINIINGKKVLVK